MEKKSLFLFIILFTVSCSTPSKKVYQYQNSSLAAVEILEPLPSLQPDEKNKEIKAEKDVKDNELKDEAIDEAEEEEEYLLAEQTFPFVQEDNFDIPVVYNKSVQLWLKYFTTRGKKHLTRYLKRAGRYAWFMSKHLEEKGLPKDLIFLAMLESGFNNMAKSRAKAVGPWQFMRATGKHYNLKQTWYLDERRDPEKATLAAARYLNKLYGDFNDWELAMAAYNAGEGKIGRAIKRYKSTNFWKLAQKKYLKPETKNYVPKIMALAIIGKNLKKYGFDEISFQPPIAFEEVEVGPFTDLIALAEILKIKSEELFKLNPELLRWFTPPRERYKLRIPTEVLNAFKTLNDAIPVVKFKTYKINKKMRLTSVSKVHRIRHKSILADINAMNVNQLLSPGTIIKLPFRLGDTSITNNHFYADLLERPNKMKFHYYRIKKGETLYHIARKYRTSVKKIIASNASIGNLNKIKAGARIIIPKGRGKNEG